ncbi:MAG: NAD(P)-binding domain-containing protein, partial [Thermoleophilaceae bacterium]
MSTLTGVLGFPVEHSRSPLMMNAAFAELGLDWRYLKLPVPPQRFDETVRALPASGYRGANVTIPHKLAAHDLADELSDAARAIGAVNTLTFRDDGRIAGDNTDAGGLLDALGQPLPPSALVLGAGGAGRAAAWALAQAGVEVTVWNRTPERAVELAAALGVSASERPGPAELLVNATSVGLRHTDSLDGLPLVDARVVVDLVYG